MLSTISQLLAQNPALQEKLADIKQSSAANKQALAHYTWLEQQTISLKGEVKKTQQFQVRIGPDGQQQKTELNPQPAPQPSGGRVKRHVVEKKTEEFEAYGQQIAALGKQYSPAELQRAYQQGNVSMQPNGEGGTVSLIIKSYLKPNDSVTMVQSAAEGIQSIRLPAILLIRVTRLLLFQFAVAGWHQPCDGSGERRQQQLGVQIQNSTYQPLIGYGIDCVKICKLNNRMIDIMSKPTYNSHLQDE
jgi:hypothetical protein